MGSRSLTLMEAGLPTPSGVQTEMTSSPPNGSPSGSLLESSVQATLTSPFSLLLLLLERENSAALSP